MAAKQIMCDRRGSAMLGLVLVMLMVGAMTIMFVTKIGSRGVLVPGPIQSSQAYYHAHSGVEYFLRNTSDHTENMDDDTEIELDMGGATVTLTYTKDTDVLVSTAVMGGYPPAQSSIRISNVSRYVPSSSESVTVWAMSEGDPDNVWTNIDLAHDDEEGPNSQYAVITDAHNNSSQGLADFDAESQPYEITSVEMVIHYYLPEDLTEGRLKVRWSRQSDNKKGAWQQVTASELNAAVGPGGLGTIVKDMGNGQAIGGWSWSLFQPPADFQVEVQASRMDSDDILYIDCVGVRISWEE